MRLSWATPKEIAAALLATHPDADRVALSPENLLSLIQALPAFDDGSAPPPQMLDHIRWTWMRLADEAPEARCA